MNLVDFVSQGEDLGFLNVSSAQTASLHELFIPATTSSFSWNLSGRDIQVGSCDEKTDLVAKRGNIKKIKSSSSEYNAGEINESLARDLCEGLNDLSEQTGVGFSADRLMNPLSGGTCSAMSFQFADDYLRISSSKSFHIAGDSLIKSPPLSPEQIFDKIEDKYKTSSESYRTIQAAFNTLYKKHSSGDFMKDKIAAMLRFYDRYISDTSEMFYIENGGSAESAKALETIESFLSNYSDGVFVVRCIIFDDNDKGEMYGHSTILIRNQGMNYFFDCNEGIYNSESDLESLLVDVLKPMMQKWIVPYGRIYKIE